MEVVFIFAVGILVLISVSVGAAISYYAQGRFFSPPKSDPLYPSPVDTENPLVDNDLFPELRQAQMLEPTPLQVDEIPPELLAETLAEMNRERGAPVILPTQNHTVEQDESSNG